MPEPKTHTPPAPLVALVGWLLPGFGYWLLGQRARALTICITVLSLFTLGCLIGGVRIVEAPSGGATFISSIAEKPWFVPQALAGPITIAAAFASHELQQNSQLKFITPHARIAEIPTLYTAVAGMLNLLAIIDASYRAGQREEAK